MSDTNSNGYDDIEVCELLGHDPYSKEFTVCGRCEEHICPVLSEDNKP